MASREREAIQPKRHRTGSASVGGNVIDMKAIILAAGMGKRLRPHTLDRPKCLVEIGGVSLLDRQLSVLRSCGVDEVIIVGGYRSEMLRDKASRLWHNSRFEETNMVWSLFCAEDELSGEVVVSYGDIVYSRETLSSLLSSSAEIAVAVDMNWETYWRSRSENPLADAESLLLGEDGRILEIGQPANSLSEIEGQYMGLMKFMPEGTKKLKKRFHEAVRDQTLEARPVEFSHLTDLLQALIREGHKVTAVENRDPWVEIDTVRDLLSDVAIRRLGEISKKL